jgi:tripartite-type tricarboxylate transporter receptor subunit TctC
LPDAPTIAEFFQKDFEEDTWIGSVVPAKTPKETVSKMADWLRAAILAAEVQPKLAALGFNAAAMCGTEFAAFLRGQVSEYSRIIREANIKAE